MLVVISVGKAIEFGLVHISDPPSGTTSARSIAANKGRCCIVAQRLDSA
jgi:hypothetical protein